MDKNSSKHLLFFLLMIAGCDAAAQTTLRLSPQNPHYLEYKGKPVLLITSGEHYGALLNLDFDYLSYLNTLQKQGMNNTRVFSGSYVERKNDIKFMQYNNTLAPQAEKLIAPWKRSTVPGYINGGNKFDLDQWDDQYFKRLKDFVTQAGNRGIMVELTLFGNQYNDSIYHYSPLYTENNIQGVGRGGLNNFLYFQSLNDDTLVARQEAMDIKIVQEMNDFDNLYYEISNEPYNEVKDSALVDRWMEHMVNFVSTTEESLPKKHIIATNQSIVDNKKVGVANYHYVHIPNMPDFDSLLRLNKVISMDETMGSLFDASADEVRAEAWDFILHGGGAYDNLNWEYTPSQPAGTPGADTIRQYLQYLQKFMAGFNFVKMLYKPGTIKASPQKAITRVLAEPGKQYALYILHSEPYDIIPPTEKFITKYTTSNRTFKDTVMLSLPQGNYTMQWYQPKSGQWIAKPITVHHPGGDKQFYTPLFTTDIALRIICN